VASRPRALVCQWVQPNRLVHIKEELDKPGVEVVQAPFQNEAELLEVARDAEGLFENPVHITREVMEQLPNLRVLCAAGIGVDRFDVEAATDLGIVVVNLPRVFHREVAAHAMALLLGLIRKVTVLDAGIKAWAKAPAGPSWPRTPEGVPHHHVYGETLGLVAFAWFDYLTDQGYYWISRFRSKTSYHVLHVSSSTSGGRARTWSSCSKSGRC